jgi:hypothetical protein
MTKHQPVLTLALGKLTDNINYSQQEISSEMRQMWTVFTKCKDSLENGRRLENMVWRLWFKSTMDEDEDKLTGQTQHQQINTRKKKESLRWKRETRVYQVSLFGCFDVV